MPRRYVVVEPAQAPSKGLGWLPAAGSSGGSGFFWCCCGGTTGNRLTCSLCGWPDPIVMTNAHPEIVTGVDSTTFTFQHTPSGYTDFMGNGGTTAADIAAGGDLRHYWSPEFPHDFMFYGPYRYVLTCGSGCSVVCYVVFPNGAQGSQFGYTQIIANWTPQSTASPNTCSPFYYTQAKFSAYASVLSGGTGWLVLTG